MCQLIPTKHVYRNSPNAWALELFDKHEEVHWLPEETPMIDDIRDWKNKASEGNKNFIRNISLFFTQADVEVGNTYIDEYLPQYKDDLSIRMMLTSFAAREGIHVKAYAFLVDSLGLGDETFSEFMDDPALLDLHNALNKYTGGDVEQRFKRMCSTSLLGEGTMLFGQFAMLLNFQRWNMFNGMCTIVAWSIRDEDLHVQGIAKLMKVDTEFAALPYELKLKWFNEVRDEIMPRVKRFAKNCFDGADVPEITFDQISDFLDFQAERRARQANICEDEITVKNPFPWFDQIIGGIEDGNFFERRRTEYAKNNLVGDWEY